MELYDSPLYPVTPEEADAFVAGQRHGTLIATPPAGHPQVSILPFVKEGDRIDLHCVQADPTFAAVRANPRVTFFVSDFLAFSPHHWLDADDAGRATLHFRAVTFECIATVSTEPGDVAAALAALLRRQEPGAAYRPIEDDAFYGPRLRRLAAVRLDVVGAQAKFKVGPGASIDAKRKVAEGLRLRDEPGDARAADVIEEALRRREGASGGTGGC
jgi:transcriptional regulator